MKLKINPEFDAFMERLEPYLNKVSHLEVNEDFARKTFEIQSRYASFIQYHETLNKRHRHLCAEILLRLHESWAPYDTLDELNSSIYLGPYPDSTTTKISICLKALKREGFIETQGNRCRISKGFTL